MAAQSSTSLVAMPQLTGVNFSSWFFRVRLFLEKEGVSEVLDIELDSIKEENAKTAFKKNDVKARHIIVQCVTDKHIEYIREASTAKAMMEALKNIFERKSCLSKMFVMKRLLKMKFSGGELQDHFVQVELLLRELEALGTKLDDTDKACYLLLTMPERFNVVITALETLNKTITFDFVKNRLLDAEMKLKETTFEDKDTECSFAAKNDNGCFECKSKEHFRKDCPKLKASQNKASRGSNNNRRGQRRGRGYGTGGKKKYEASVNTAEDINRDILFVATENSHALSSSEVSDTCRFILDSEASDHLVS